MVAMARLSWSSRGHLRRQRELARLDAVDMGAGVDGPCDREVDLASQCDDDCSLCDPLWYVRELIRRRLASEVPAFTLADRVLAQAGIILRLDRRAPDVARHEGR